MSEKHPRKTESELISERVENSKREIEKLKAEYEKLVRQGLKSSTSPSEISKESNSKSANDSKPISEVINSDKKSETYSSSKVANKSSSVSRSGDKPSSQVKFNNRYGKSASASNKFKINLKNNLGDNRSHVERTDVISERKNVIPPSVNEVGPRSSGRNRGVSPAKDPEGLSVCRSKCKKSYDVEEAREFMRRQKEKRLEQLRMKVKESVNTVEERKRKLKELNQKSLLIITKNRERSRSRSKETPRATDTIPPLQSIDINNYPKAIDQKRSSRERITVRHQPPPQLTYRVTKDDELRERAATIIQSHFRGHKQRKIYKQQSLDAKKESTSKQNRRDFPDWLRAKQSCPYNFISAVKQKLSIAVNTPVKTSDVAVQYDTKEVKRRIEEKKSSIEESAGLKEFIRSIRGEDPLVLDLKAVESLRLKAREGEKSGSDTSKNVPDLSTENGSSCKRGYSSSFESPEANTSVESCKTYSKDVFKRPQGVAKRTKKSDSSSNKENSVPAVSTDAASSDSDGGYKLEINTERLKKLRLMRRKERHDGFDNTLDEDGKRTNEIPLEENTKHSELSIIETTSNKSSSHSNNDEDMLRRRSIIISSNRSIVSPDFSDRKNVEAVESESVKEELASFRDYMRDFKMDRRRREKRTSGKESVASFRTMRSTSSEGRSKGSEGDVVDAVLPLVVPGVSLRSHYGVGGDVNKGITLKAGEKEVVNAVGTSNQIHVKFEAELHLLNDFNESLRQFMAIEKSLLDLQNKSNNIQHENRDTQTSFLTKSTTEPTAKSTTTASSNVATVASLNYSRGSDFHQEKSSLLLNSFDDNETSITNNVNVISEDSNKSLLANSAFEISEINESTQNDTKNESLEMSQVVVNSENKVYAGLSLGMFEQLIKDEDARIENLKTILKIREKALLDRTKGELAWFEIQKKHLLETGKLHEASLVKKKQRGILIKLQHEKHEMQKLKQIQKAASKERKTILKEQRNMIKTQLSMNSTVTKIKRTTSKERRLSGPLKVYNYHRETLKSETSISKRSSVAEEIIYESRSESVLSNVRSEEAEKRTVLVNSCTEIAKRSLQMREAALQKRRKTAEELLRWHRKLLEEERKIAELEVAASNIVNQVTVDKSRYKFSGAQLNVLWESMTGRAEKKFKDGGRYDLSQVALERFCKEAKECSKVAGVERSEIMQNISDITDEISELYKLSSAAAACGESVDKTLVSEDRVVSVEEISKDSARLSRGGEEVQEDDVSETVEDQIKSDLSANEEEVGVSEQLISGEELSEPCEDSRKTIEGNSCESTDGGFEEIAKESDVEKSSSVEDESVVGEEDVEEKIPSEISAAPKSPERNESLQHHAIEGTMGKDAKNSHNTSVKRSVVAVSKPDEEIEDSSEITDNLGDTDEDEKASEESPNVVEVSEREEIEEGEYDVKSMDDVEAGGDEESRLSSIESHVNPEAADVKSKMSESEEMLDVELVKGNELFSIESHLNPEASVEMVDVKSDVQSESRKSSIEMVDEEADGVEESRLASIETQLNPENFIEALDVESEISKSKEVSVETVDDVESDIKKAKGDEEALNSTHLNRTASSEDADLSTSKLSLKIKTDDDVNRTTSNEDCSDIKDSSTSKLSDDDDVNRKTSIQDGESGDSEDSSTSILSLKVTIDDDVNRSTSIEVGSDFKDLSTSKSPDDVMNRETCNLNLLGSGDFKDKEESSSIEEGDVAKSIDSNEVFEFELEIEDKSVDSDDVKSKFGDVEDVSERSLISSEVSAPIIEVLIEEKKRKSGGLDGEEVDVKRRVSKILADANINVSLGDKKGPRMQDLYVTTYDVMSPEGSPELGSPVENKSLSSKDIYGNEAEELLRKQLAIEQEIKQLEQQQLPYLYMREIPNKPPPPYTPPVQPIPVMPTTVLPMTIDQIYTMTPNISKILFKAYKQNTLSSASLPEEATFDSVDRECGEFVFDLCKEIASEHFSQFQEISAVSWMKCNNRRLGFKRPLKQSGLKTFLDKQLKQIFGFEKVELKESMIIKWSRKKRDHVDELLVMESQAEEAEWTNYDQDELIVKNDLTKDILQVLLKETADVFEKIVAKRALMNVC